MGPPNWPKDGVYPLSGLVETDWLPFPFTMNWQMTRAGSVSFSAGWQRHYMRGETSEGKTGSEDHLTKRRLQKPKDLRGGALFKK